MNVSGSLVLDAAPGSVRELLADPERLSALLPNVDTFGWSDGPAEGSFAVTIRPALALGEIPVRTVWQRVDRDAAANELRYRIDGRTDEQRVGFDVTLRVDAAEGDDARTLVVWSLEVEVTGTLRTAGQRVVAPIVDRQVRAVLSAAEGAAR